LRREISEKDYLFIEKTKAKFNDGKIKQEDLDMAVSAILSKYQIMKEKLDHDKKVVETKKNDLIYSKHSIKEELDEVGTTTLSKSDKNATSNVHNEKKEIVHEIKREVHEIKKEIVVEKQEEKKKELEKKEELKKEEKKEIIIEKKEIDNKKEKKVKKNSPVVEKNLKFLKDFFNTMDKNDSDSISLGEWVEANKYSELYANSRTSKFFFQKIDKNNDGKISFEEFVHHYNDHYKDVSEEDFEKTSENFEKDLRTLINLVK